MSECFKGAADELNNAILGTYKLHPENKNPCPITAAAARNVHGKVHSVLISLIGKFCKKRESVSIFVCRTMHTRLVRQPKSSKCPGSPSRSFLFLKIKYSLGTAVAGLPLPEASSGGETGQHTTAIPWLRRSSPPSRHGFCRHPKGPPPFFFIRFFSSWSYSILP